VRVISSDALTALDSGRFRVRCLLKVDTDDGPFAIWDDVGDISVSSITYTGAPGRFSVGSAVSVADFSARNCDVTLSGLDLETAALIDQADWHQRPITIQRAIISEEAPQVIHLMPYFVGFLDQMVWREKSGGSSIITFRCEASARELMRKGTRTRSNSDQRQRDSADGFFAAVVAASTKSIVWGRQATPPTQSPPRRKILGIFG
jgi:hypothetical protein